MINTCQVHVFVCAKVFARKNSFNVSTSLKNNGRPFSFRDKEALAWHLIDHEMKSGGYLKAGNVKTRYRQG